MKYPIPRPKQMTFTGKTVPAAFDAVAVDAVFEPALRVFRQYACRAFGDAITAGGSLTLVLQPDLGDGYRISIGEQTVLTAANNVGMNYAFATLLQLAEQTADGMVYPCCEIEDAPDNDWRGLMLDLARCYHEIEYLFAVADMCWLYKISRYQLHLTDDQGIRFPFESLPEAVSDEHYTREQLTELVAYCRDRGIVIVPEIDAPGHFRAFNAAYPQLFGTAPKASGNETTAQSDVVSGIMRAEESTFRALERLFREVAEFFTDSPWLHMGGDEADIAQWEDCPISTAYREQHGLKNVHELYGHCVARLCRAILDMERIPVVWECFAEECNDMIPKETLVFSWESYYQTAPQLLAGGFEIINASWVPLYVVSPHTMWDANKILDWEKNIWQHWWEKSAAHETPITVPEDAPIVGGQLCVWGDCMQPSRAEAPRHDMLRTEFANLRLRLPALAEKVWTSYHEVDKDAFAADFSAHDALLDKLIV